MPLRLSAKDRRSHVGIFSDIGGGKSQFLSQLLMEIERRGEVAAVWDPDREYARKFRNVARGDWILDPSVEECPYYAIEDEAETEGEAIQVASCFFPDTPGAKDPYWQSAARRLYAYLTRKERPTAAELGFLMAHDYLLDDILKHSEFRTILTNKAPGLRSSVISHLNMAAQPLRMLPQAIGSRRRFSVRDWCNHRKGWIFLTSTPIYTEALKPLHTLWLASLIMRISGMGYRPDLPIVNFIIEEAASLNVHEFHLALVRLRKTRCPVYYAIQNYSDLKAVYGDYAPSMFSQPLTKIIGRTSDPDSADRLSRTIGKKKVRRLRESYMIYKNLFGIPNSKQRSYHETEEEVDIVPAHRLQNLEDRDLFVVQPGKVTYMRLPIVELPDRKPPIQPRVIPDVENREPDINLDDQLIGGGPPLLTL